VATASEPITPASASVRHVGLELGLDDERWKTYVSSHPRALAFHRPAWSQLLADCYGYRPFALAVLDDEGAIAGGLPLVEVRGVRGRRWIGLPFTDFCPPLLQPGTNGGAFAQTLAQARTAAHVGSLEVRAELDGPGVHRRADAVTHSLALAADPETLFERFHRSQVQRNIRRADREDLVVRRGETKSDLTRVYYRLHVETRRRLGAPAQPRRFFEGLWTRLLEPDHGRVMLVYAGSKPIAGAVFLTGGTTVTYKYGASDASEWRLRPNHLLFWTAIRWACEDGYRTFDFGRSDADDRGLRDFKSGWAAREEPLVYSTLAQRAPASATGRSMGAARAVLRRSPTWLCRATGEIIYRFAA